MDKWTETETDELSTKTPKDKSLSNISYGELIIDGCSQCSRYIKMLDDYPEYNELIYHKMISSWGFLKPYLIISINSEATNLIGLSFEEQSAIKQSLMNVANVTPTWIITDGEPCGITKLVGDAIKGHSVRGKEKLCRVIGIRAWNDLKFQDKLELDKNDRGRDKTVTLNKSIKELPDNIDLNPNHDGYILYDKNNVEDWKYEFEEFLLRKAGCHIVHLVIGGGSKTLSVFNKACTRNIPSIVIKGSNYAAEFICEIKEGRRNWEDMETILVKGDTTKKIVDTPKKDEKEMKKVEKCKKLIFILPLEKILEKFSSVILDVISSRSIEDKIKKIESRTVENNASKDEKKIPSDEELKWYIIFNNYDKAKKYISDLMNVKNFIPFQPMPKKAIVDFREHVMTAINKDQPNLVELLLPHATDLSTEGRNEFIKKLYSVTPDNEKSTDINDGCKPEIAKLFKYYQLDSEANDQAKVTIDKLQTLIEKLTKNIIMGMYKEDEGVKSSNVNVVCSDVSTKKSISKNVKDKNVGTDIEDKLPYQYQDVFISCLLFQKWEMAIIFLKNGRDRISSALVAAVVCKSLIRLAKREGDDNKKKELIEHQIKFENLAISILNEAFKIDKMQSQILLVRRIENWQGVTCMEIAVKGQLYNFVRCTAYQLRLRYAWSGHMPQFTSNYMILANLPLAIITSWCFIFQGKRYPNCCGQKIKESKLIKVGQNLKQIKCKYQLTHADDKKLCFYSEFYKTFEDTKVKIKVFQAIAYYFQAPRTKFSMNIISYFIFLALYSYVCLVELKPLNDVSTIAGRQIEHIIYAYIISFIMEEIRKVAHSNYEGKAKVREWISSWWTIFDILLYIVFVIAVILRNITSLDFVYARTLYSLVLSMYFIRFLQFYYVHRTVGPKCIMVFKMMKDVLFFLSMYVIAILAYGTLARALLFNNSPLDGSLLKNIVYLPYFQSYGDLHLDYVEGTVPVANVIPTPNAIVICAFVLFMLFVNILLMNLLVAMFTKTFEKVEQNSGQLWTLLRHQICEEFYARPIMPPPLNFIEIIIILIMAIHRKIRKKKLFNQFSVRVCESMSKYCTEFETYCMEAYLINDKSSKRETDENKDKKYVTNVKDKAATTDDATIDTVEEETVSTK